VHDRAGDLGRRAGRLQKPRHLFTVAHDL
jgi:hypothetical protein